MQIPILIEPVEGGRFRARAGDPFAACAEGSNAEEATRLLKSSLDARLQPGSQISMLEMGNGSQPVRSPLYLEPVADDDWFFRTLEYEIEKNRKLEDESNL